MSSVHPVVNLSSERILVPIGPRKLVRHSKGYYVISVPNDVAEALKRKGIEVVFVYIEIIKALT